MSWILYGAAAVLMVYLMSRGGGCCGGFHGNHEDNNGSYNGHHGGGCCGGNMDHSNREEHNEELMENTEDRNIGMVQDPICGMYVSKQDAISRRIKGREYYFCSGNCAEEFERKNAV